MLFSEGVSLPVCHLYGEVEVYAFNSYTLLFPTYRFFGPHTDIKAETHIS
jgi:hypothetical protein